MEGAMSVRTVACLAVGLIAVSPLLSGADGGCERSAISSGDEDGGDSSKQIVVLQGEGHYCPAGVMETLACDADPGAWWWCTEKETCDVWGCAPVWDGGKWHFLEAAPAGGCTDGCPDDFDAAVAEMEYCDGMVCLEIDGADCRMITCVEDGFYLEDVDCPDLAP
jgi:hypothetical protein